MADKDKGSREGSRYSFCCSCSSWKSLATCGFLRRSGSQKLSKSPTSSSSAEGGGGSCLMRLFYVIIFITAVGIFCTNLLAGYRIQMEIQRDSPRGESLSRVYSIDLRQSHVGYTSSGINEGSSSSDHTRSLTSRDNSGSGSGSASSESTVVRRVKHADGSVTTVTAEDEERDRKEAAAQNQQQQQQQGEVAAKPQEAVPDSQSGNQQAPQSHAQEDPEAYPAVDQNGKKIFPPDDEHFLSPARSKGQPVRDDSSLRNYMPSGHIPHPQSAEYQQECSKHHPPGEHAIFTMATADRAARLATALLQSLRDANTCHSIDLNIMISGGGIGSEDCMNKVIPQELKSQCRSLNLTHPRGAVSQIFLSSWEQMNVKVRLVKPVARDSEYVKLPGGKQIAWGMAFNKLNVFGFTEYKKILWMDSDTLVLRNLDHLLWYPEFTAAFTNDCCNRNAPAKISGGFWVIQPSKERLNQVIDLAHSPTVLKESRLEAGDNWFMGDMSMVAALFTRGRKLGLKGFPWSIDPRHGPIIEGVRNPKDHWSVQHAMRHRDLQRDEQGRMLLAGPEDITVTALAPYRSEKLRFVTSDDDLNWGDTVGRKHGAPFGRTWHILNASYDALPMDCNCIPDRDLGFENYFSIHLTCFGSIKKPTAHSTFTEFQQRTDNEYPACIRPYFHAWIKSYKRGLGSLFTSDLWVTPREGYKVQ